MTRLIVADDHAMFREGLSSKFRECPDIALIGEAGSGRELMELLKDEYPEVLILDIKMPDVNGLTLLHQIKAVRPDCRVIILTMYDHVRYAVHALSSGADGYMVKGSPFEELLQAVREVREGRTYVSASMAPKLADQLRRQKVESPLDTLSQREFEVLTLLGSGLSIKKASEQMGISQKTVTTYRIRIMEKLGVTQKADLIRLALEVGLVD